MTLTKCNTMQKIINVLAVLSFAGVAGIVGGGTYVYLQKDALIESAKGKVAKAAAEAIAGALPGMMDSAMPEMPKMTGGAIPSTGGVGFPGAAAKPGPAIRMP